MALLCGPVKVTDFDFADDITLISDEVLQAQELLCSLELECNMVGLRLNAAKTKVMAYNIDGDFAISTLEGLALDCCF